ncbi:glycosyltransferase family 8 protein [Herbaspirillum robiniae]|uniref:UDP-glucose--(Glucosyl) LPS alpha 1,3-glucosyltransferase WaaO n=1 Tax=Herbaspirillum robiniae TaxID=2014887 RepID=A0ABX2M0Z7_9BURK|nr:glycosyltransferase [Herbaspirillum robiniae]NUU01936.1 UDP-glucose--(glucosyl) LPS alpha 1,3-glucosyltransferase WaaO [Herbaspirillum robiniae]
MNEAVQAGAAPAADAFHVVFCVDDRYFRCMGATIASIVANNPARNFAFHVLATKVSDDNRRRFAALANGRQVSTHLHLLDASLFSRFEQYTKSSYYSSAIFARLVIPDILKSYTDRVLYLDADILCVGNIDELAQLDLSGDIAAVVPDAEATTRRRVEALKLKHPRYFNSGMLYINIPAWIAAGITQQTIDAILKDGEQFRFPDQDALNVVLDGRARFVGIRWNYLYGLVGDLENNRPALAIPDGAATFIHFAGSVKPWGVWSGHDSVRLFEKYHALSGWSDQALDLEPTNYKELRMHSRFQWARGNRIDSLRWYWRYLMVRRARK